MRFASDEWLAAVAAALAEVSLDSGASARIIFEIPGRSWHLAVDGGRVVSFAAGPLGSADCVLRWTADDAAAVWRRELRGNAALLATEVSADAAGGPYRGPPAPLDIRSRPELAALPVVPGATFDVQYAFRSGPFGDVDYVIDFRDGRVDSDRLERLDDPTVAVEVSYRAMARVRAGETTILEALEDGRVTGEVGALAMLAGISESPEFEAAQIATGRHAFALATLGELDATPEYAWVLADLAIRTSR